LVQKRRNKNCFLEGIAMMSWKFKKKEIERHEALPPISCIRQLSNPHVYLPKSPEIQERFGK